MDPIGSLRRMMWLGIFALTLLGCQTYDEGVRVICDSAAVVGADDLPPPDRATLASSWVFEHLHNADARAFYRTLAPLPPDGKAAAVRRAAAEAGLTECSLAEVWEMRWDETWQSPSSEPGSTALAER